ncbi:hypothetical protein PSP6_130114 [Paraburkholderia tropica]|nr:hypothetical protein PSP6_130114 [Paraburkholderia tropica]
MRFSFQVTNRKHYFQKNLKNLSMTGHIPEFTRVPENSRLL